VPEADASVAMLCKLIYKRIFKMTAAEFIAYCKTHLGKPYIWGANGPDTFDCSGFAQFVLGEIGLDDPKEDLAADGLYRRFKQSQNGTVIPKGLCGALVFYGIPNRVTHVAVCLDDINMIEAGGGGPKTKTVEIARKQKAEVRIKLINRRKDIVAIVLPKNLPWMQN